MFKYLKNLEFEWNPRLEIPFWFGGDEILVYTIGFDFSCNKKL